MAHIEQMLADNGHWVKRIAALETRLAPIRQRLTEQETDINRLSKTLTKQAGVLDHLQQLISTQQDAFTAQQGKDRDELLVGQLAVIYEGLIVAMVTLPAMRWAPRTFRDLKWVLERDWTAAYSSNDAAREHAREQYKELIARHLSQADLDAMKFLKGLRRESALPSIDITNEQHYVRLVEAIARVCTDPAQRKVITLIASRARELSVKSCNT